MKSFLDLAALVLFCFLIEVVGWLLLGPVPK
jgi:hypothetical protein